VRLETVAESFPWGGAPRDTRGNWEDLWWWWNLGFVRAAGDLCRAVRVLDEAELHDETYLPLRSLAELVANQGYMAADPERRAPEFTEADLAARERLLSTLERLGPPFRFSSEAISDVRKSIVQVKDELAHSLMNVESTESMYPFGRKARARMEAAGMVWHYDGLYETSSDFVHMNARAVAGYMGRAAGEGRPNDATAQILMAIELLLRSLYFGDAALELEHRGDLDDYAMQYVKVAFQGGDPVQAVQRLWPPSSSSSDPDGTS
jgi:hypothetical protein